jgi:HAD superfamily hydrolase (TIGR01549 family)
MLPESQLHLHAKDVLHSLLETETQIGLVSTSKLVTIKPILFKHQLLDLFGVIVTGDMVKSHKPDPESIVQAMEKLNSEKSTTIMVGDSEKDILSAKMPVSIQYYFCLISTMRFTTLNI